METNKNTVLVIFFSLLTDLLAFTIILPLFPALLDYYRDNDKNGLHNKLTEMIKIFQETLKVPEEYNSVLFGGILGSMYSLMQFIASPIIGALSDKYGRKPILLLSLSGIAVSHILWFNADTMLMFVLARFIGGLSKGNISLCISIITDVTNKNTRGKSMALVGIAFSLGFIFGPMIGAVFSHIARKQGTWFIYPSLIASSLGLINICLVVVFFKETLPQNKRTTLDSSFKEAKSLLFVNDLFQFSAVKRIKAQDLAELRTIGLVYFVYLFIFSGLEFTLTFLLRYRFGYTAMEQGYVFFGIGLTMAILQGAVVRRIPDNKTKPAAILGLLLLIPAFIFIGIATSSTSLFLGLFLFAVSTAFVVSCFTTMVSNYGGADQKGTVMGIFRSLGCLARAVGPVIASALFWGIGSSLTYLIGAVLLVWPYYKLKSKKVT